VYEHEVVIHANTQKRRLPMVVFIIIIIIITGIDIVGIVIVTETNHRMQLALVTKTWAQIHRYCLKINPKMCHKIIIRHK